MRYEWDEEKNQNNIRKHGLDFSDAWEVFSAPMLVGLDDRQDYGEDRWLGVGMLRSRVIVVCFTERGEDSIRIISMRKATSEERKRYEQALRDRLGPG
jgi:uncharacterized DUF497 family protein